MMQEDGSKAETPVKITIKDGKKPAEVYRTDLITAMKIPDHQLLTPGTYYDLSDPWKQEWERGVQVPVNKESLPQPSFSISNSVKHSQTEFRMPYKLVKCGKKKENALQKSPLYDLDDEDVEWLKALNKSRANDGNEVDELLMEKAIECLENQCYTNMGETISTAKGLSIEYDEDIVCDICRSPECEDGNEILFCDVCDVAVHQACYGVQKVPIGSWVCKLCAQQLYDCPCLLCSTRGGAMKKTKSKGVNGWVHMSCALWIPEVGIGNVEKMEPITRIETITPGRWNLLCYICKEKRGACIQCSVKSCVTAFHVTCGFNNNLHMETVWDDSAPDGVRHVCYCSKHTEKRCGRSPRKSSSSVSSPIKSPQKSSTRTTPSKSSKAKEEEERENLRQNRLRGMEEEFYKYADVDVLASELNITTELATSFHRFWTLKRKAREDAALLSPTAEQQDLLSGRQIKPFQKATMEIERVVRFRQDLERIRNLCYMIERREKMKRELTATREAVFRKQLEVVDDTSGKMSTEDVRWARSCCVKNFTEYEELQEIDLQWPVKPKIHKKRGRKPKRKWKKLTNGLVQPTVMCQSDGVTTEHSGECGESDCRDPNNDSTFFSSDNGIIPLDNEATTSSAGVRDNSTMSCENSWSDIDERVRSLRNKPSARLGSSNDNGMSSDSDFEDESTRKSKRRASIGQLRVRKSSKLDAEVARVSGSSKTVSTDSSSIHTRGSSPIHTRDSSPIHQLQMRKSSKLDAEVPGVSGSGEAVLTDSSSIHTKDSSRIHSGGSSPIHQLRMRKPSKLDAEVAGIGGSREAVFTGISSIHTKGSSPIRTRGSSPIRTRGSSPIQSRGSSPIQTRGSSPIQTRGSSPIQTRGSSPIHTRGSSPVQPKGGLNGLNMISAINLPEFKESVKNNVCLSPKNAADRQLKRNRKRLFCELAEKRQEPLSPRTLRSNGAVLGVQLACNAASEKRICRPNGVLHTNSSDKSRCDPNSLRNEEIQIEKEVKLEVRLTRSRSRTSVSDSPKSSSELSDELHTANTLSEKNANKPKMCQTRSNKNRVVSSSIPSKVNGVLCNGKNVENFVKNVPQLVQQSLLNSDEVSDIAPRTRSRGNALNVDPYPKDASESRVLSTFPDSQTNCMKNDTTKKVISERGRSPRHHTKLSENLGASKATMYNSPTKCSKFFGKLRQTATTRA